jgi:spermidine/putrescine transport system ATP-binding protein
VAEFIGVMNFLPAEVAGDRVRVAGLGEMALTEVQGTATTDGAPMAGFRPETATLLFPGQTAPDREAAGRVHEVVYYGDMTYYDVTLDGADRPVRVSMRNVFGRPVLERGSVARLAWAPGAVTLFR